MGNYLMAKEADTHNELKKEERCKMSLHWEDERSREKLSLREICMKIEL